MKGKIEICKDLVVGNYYEAKICGEDGICRDIVKLEYLGIKEYDNDKRIYKNFLDRKNMVVVEFTDDGLISYSVDCGELEYRLTDCSTYNYWELKQRGENSTCFDLIVKTPTFSTSTSFDIKHYIDQLIKR